MASAEPLTPERRRAMTRRALLDAAADEFAAKGFHGASLDVVAKAAGFTKGAVYSNFESKADLFLALMDDRLDREHSLLTSDILELHGPLEEQFDKVQQRQAELRSDDTLRALFFEFVVYSMRNPEVRDRLIEFTRRQQAGMEAMISLGLAEVGITPRYPVELLTFVSWALHQGIELYRVIDPDGVPPEREAALLALERDLMGVLPDADAAESSG